MSRSIDYTFCNLYNRYIELMRPHLSAHELDNRVSIWKNHLQPLAPLHATQFKYSICQDFVNSLLNKGLKPKTIKNIKSFCQVILKLAILDEVISTNPFEYVRIRHTHTRFTLPLNDEEQKRLIRTILSYDEPIYKDIFLLLLHGRRLGEVLKMQWRHVSFSKREILISAEINKARQDMVYKMTDSLYLSLTKRYARLFERFGVVGLDDYVFTNPLTGEPFKDIRRAWKRLLKSANVPYFKLHALRHVVGSYSVNVLELPIEKVADTLGHTSIRTTEIYRNTRPKNSHEVISKLISSV